MDKDYKVVLVNTKDPDGEKILNQSKDVVRQVPDEYFKFQSVGQHDFCDVSLSGQLADDPAFYFKKRDRNSRRHGDNFTDNSVFVNLNIICTLRTYHDKYGQLKEVTSNVSARSFREYDKRALALYHKGDRVTVQGSLRTYSDRDASKSWFYIEINSFTVNPYKTMSKMASDAFDAKEPVRRTNDILSDYRISNEEKKSQLEWINLQKDRKLKEQEEQIACLRKTLSDQQKEKILKADQQTDSLQVEPMIKDSVTENDDSRSPRINYQNTPEVPFEKIEPTDDAANLNSLDTLADNQATEGKNGGKDSPSTMNSTQEKKVNQFATGAKINNNQQDYSKSYIENKPVTTDELDKALNSVFW